MRFWSSNVINFPAWQTDFSFGTQPQGTGDMKISNCHVYGLADMTVPVQCMVPICIWERRSLPHNCTQLLRSCWGRMCLITDGYYSGYTTNSNFWLLGQYIIISTLQGVNLCEEKYKLCENKMRIANNLLIIEKILQISELCRPDSHCLPTKHGLKC